MANTKTKAEIAGRVLEKLGVKAQGQNASAQDQILAEEAVASVHAKLTDQRRIEFDVELVPDWAWTPLIYLVARDLVDDFGISGERLQSILSSAARADRDLWDLQADNYDPDNYQTVKFY